MNLVTRISALASAVGAALKGDETRITSLEARVTALETNVPQTPAVMLDTTAFPTAMTVGAAVTGAVKATLTGGATGPVTISVDILPPGVTLGTAVDKGAGVWQADLSGTPTTEGTGTANFTASNGTQTDVQTVQFAVGAAPSVALDVSGVPTSATVGTAYSGQATATNQNGATGTFTYSATGLPAGLSIDAATGAISGNPTTAGTVTATITVTNGTQSASADVGYTIVAAATPAVVLTLDAPTTAQIGTPYTGQASAVNQGGATGAITYSATGMPGGVSIDSGTGAISGTPTVSGPFNVAVTATNGAQSDTEYVTITVAAAAAPTSLIVQQATGSVVTDGGSKFLRATLPIAATPNNVLLFATTIRKNDVAGSVVPTGFTPLFNDGSLGNFDQNVRLFGKVSDGTETVVNMPVTGTGAGECWLTELSGASSVFADYKLTGVYNTAIVAGGTPVSCNTLSLAGNGIALAVSSVYSTASAISSTTGGYTTDYIETAASTSNALVAAHRTASGDKTYQFSVKFAGNSLKIYMLSIAIPDAGTTFTVIPAGSAPPVDQAGTSGSSSPGTQNPIINGPTSRQAFAASSLDWADTTSTDTVDVTVTLDGTSEVLTLANAPLGVTPLKKSDSTNHPHLALVRYKDCVCIENMWLDNDTNYSGRLQVSVNGVSQFDQTGVNFWLRTRTPPVRQGFPQYTPGAVDASVIANYGDPGTISQPNLKSDSPGGFARLGINGIGYADGVGMGDTGGRPDIALLPGWDIPYAKQGTYWQACRDSSDHSVVWEAHARDPDTGKIVDPTYRKFISFHPNLRGTTTGGGKNPIVGTSNTPYKIDQAHTPHFNVVAYLATHSDFDMEQLLAWGCYHAHWSSPAYQGYDKGLVTGQVRGWAWALAQFGYLAKALPSTHPYKAIYRQILTNNSDYYWTGLYAPGKERNNIFGATLVCPHTDSAGKMRATPVFMENYLISALNLLCKQGVTEYTPWRNFAASFALGSMTQQCYQYATQYDIFLVTSAAGITSTTAQTYDATDLFTNWTDAFNDTRVDFPEPAGAVGLSCGQKDLGYGVGMMQSATGGTQSYPAYLQSALAAAVDGGLAGAAAAWTQFLSSRGPMAYTSSNEMNILPQGYTTDTGP